MKSTLSVANHWRSFIKHFNDYWSTEKWPDNDYPIFFHEDISDEDRDKIKNSKAWLIFDFDMFAGGRGLHGDDNIFLIKVFVKRKENTYNKILLPLLDDIIEVYEQAPCVFYDFTYDPPQLAMNSSVMIPIFESAASLLSETDDKLKVIELTFYVKTDRSSRKYDL